MNNSDDKVICNVALIFSLVGLIYIIEQFIEKGTYEYYPTYFISSILLSVITFIGLIITLGEKQDK